MNVADQNAAFLAEFFEAREKIFQQARGFGRVGNFVGTDIDHGGARTDPVWLDESRFAHGRNQNISAANDFGKVACFGMTNGDGGVGMHQQKGHGLADDVAAS